MKHIAPNAILMRGTMGKDGSAMQYENMPSYLCFITQHAQVSHEFELIRWGSLQEASSADS